jgi:hypothetical protein
MVAVSLFGTSDLAALTYFHLSRDSPHEAVGFTVERDYLSQSGQFAWLPAVMFANLGSRSPPEGHAAFAPMSHYRMNTLRQRI